MTSIKKAVIQLLNGRLDVLAERVGYTVEHLSNVLDENLPSQEQEDLLFQATDCMQTRGWNPARYEEVLSGFLWGDRGRAGGGEQRDVVGERIRSGARQIRVGWTHSPGLAWPGPSGAPEGPAIEKTKRVLHHLGLQPIWVELPYAKLIAAVCDRVVDLVVPILMRFPFRERLVRYSHPVFEPVPVACVASRAAAKRIFRDVFPSASRMIIVSLLGEIGSHLSERLFPGAECEDACESLESATHIIRSSAIRAGGDPKIRVLIADFRMCTSLAERYDDLAVLEHPAPPISETSFVMHPNETPLLSAVNGSLELMRQIDVQNEAISSTGRRLRVHSERLERLGSRKETRGQL